MDREEWCQKQVSIQVMVAFQMPGGIHLLARMLLKQNQDWKPHSPEQILGTNILGQHMLLFPAVAHAVGMQITSIVCQRSQVSHSVVQPTEAGLLETQHQLFDDLSRRPSGSFDFAPLQ